MPVTLSQKLKIKEGQTLLTINSPTDFKNSLEPLPAGVEISAAANEYDQVHWFVRNKTQMEKELDKVLSLLKENVVCWIYYPKGTSKIKTDLTRDKGWEALLAHKELQWLSLVSFDDTWSAFAMRLKTESDIKKEAAPKQRVIFNYIDAKTKIIRLPDDLANALNKNKKQQEFFNTLSFTNRKEYVEWIVTAKREETRAQRIKDTIDKLKKEWKNPRSM